MELYDNAFSPYALKVRAVLYEKDIAHEKRELTKHEDHVRLLQVNPRGEVPALVDRGVAIIDSKVICAYLEDRFPDPAVLPADPLLRAHCRYLELKSDTDIDACAFVLSILKLTRPELAKEFPQALRATQDAVARHHAYLESQIAGRDWYLGEFSLADIALTPHLRAIAFMGYPPGAQYPALSAWLKRTRSRPSITRAIREFAEAYKASQEPGGLFDVKRLHWRNDRIEFAMRVGLGGWLAAELRADRAFLSPIAGAEPSA